METLQSLIATLGFPISAYVLMFVYVIMKDKDHTEERKLFRESIDNNTKAILSLREELKRKE